MSKADEIELMLFAIKGAIAELPEEERKYITEEAERLTKEVMDTAHKSEEGQTAATVAMLRLAIEMEKLQQKASG